MGTVICRQARFRSASPSPLPTQRTIQIDALCRSRQPTQHAVHVFGSLSNCIRHDHSLVLRTEVNPIKGLRYGVGFAFFGF